MSTHLPNETVSPALGKMIAVCSAKGGIGRTVLTTNMATALASKNAKVTILDGCFQFGDIHLALDLQPIFSIKDVIEQLDDLDAEGLWHYLSAHDNGVRILAAPPRPEYADLVTIDNLDRICKLLLEKCHYLLVDTMAGLPEHSLYFIEKADHILLVTDLEMASLKNTKMMLELLTTLELRNKVQIVVNRSTMQSVINASDVPKILGEASIIYIPNDFETVSKSLSIGIPFVLKNRRTELAKAVLNMTDSYCAIEPSAPINVPQLPSAKGFLKKLKILKERAE